MELTKSIKEHLSKLSPSMRKSSKYEVIFLVVCAIFILVGIYALYLQIRYGQQVTGMRDYVVWGIYDVNFIFFIGISYAGALISGICFLLDIKWRKPIIRIAEMITVISTILGPAYILLSMGRLDRLHHLLLFGRIQSPITWDIIAITTYMIGSFIFLYLATLPDLAILRDSKEFRVSKWKKRFYTFFAANYEGTVNQKKILKQSLTVISMVIIPLAIIVHSVLSWIFGMTVRPGWHSTIFAPYFVIAAVYSGTGVLIVAMWFFRKIYHLEEYLKKEHFVNLGFLLVILGAVYGYFTFSEYLTNWYGSEKWELELIHKLFNFDQFGYWFIFSAFIGVLLPITIFSIPKFRTISGISIAALVAVTALWIKRYIIIIPTLETPLLPMQELRPEFISYHITWVEWALTLAGVAIFILFFYLLSKLIPIIPISEMAEDD